MTATGIASLVFIVTQVKFYNKAELSQELFYLLYKRLFGPNNGGHFKPKQLDIGIISRFIKWIKKIIQDITFPIREYFDPDFNPHPPESGNVEDYPMWHDTQTEQRQAKPARSFVKRIKAPQSGRHSGRRPS